MPPTDGRASRRSRMPRSDALDEARRAISRPVVDRARAAGRGGCPDRGGSREPPRHGRCSLDLSPDVVVAGEVAENLLRILREAMTNAGRHGHASTAAVRLWSNGDVHLVVEDDGCGFADGERERRGFGLVSMEERATRWAASWWCIRRPGGGRASRRSCDERGAGAHRRRSSKSASAAKRACLARSSHGWWRSSATERPGAPPPSSS